MLKGIPIILSADFSPEFPQARKDWDDIYKVIQGENIQPRIFYPARLSFRFKGESKTFTDKQTLRIQHYQTSFTTNAKGTSLGRGRKKSDACHLEVLRHSLSFWRCLCMCMCVCVKKDLHLRRSTLVYTNLIMKRRTILESYLHDYQWVFNGGKRNYLVSNIFPDSHSSM